MLTSGHHVFARDTPVDDCVRLAALFEALAAGRVRIERPAMMLMRYPGWPPVAVLLCTQ